MSTNEYTPLTGDVDIVFCNYDEEGTNRAIKEDISNNHDYTLIWKVMVNNPDLNGREVLRQCRLLRHNGFSSPLFDQPPRLRLDYYNPSFLSNGDPTAFCKEVVCDLVDTQNPYLYRITAQYSPPQEDHPNLSWTQPQPDDPLQWYYSPTGFYSTWIEYIEDQVVVEKAYCLTNMKQINRGPKYPEENTELLLKPGMWEPGPIVNAVGQQTIDPQVDSSYRMILNVKVNYPDATYAMALNRQFGGCIHAPFELLHDSDTDDVILKHQWDTSDLDLFMGFPHATWKFLLAEPQKLEYKVLYDETIVQFCPTIIKLEQRYGNIYNFLNLTEADSETVDYDSGNPDVEIVNILGVEYLYFYDGWLRPVLNNGQNCFKIWYDPHGPLPMDGNYSYIPDPKTNTTPLLFPVQVEELNDDAIDTDGHGIDDTTDVGHARVLESGQTTKQNSGEPLNLTLKGLQSTHSEIPASHIYYCSPKICNLYDITDYYGRSIFPVDIVLPVFPLAEIQPPFEEE